MQAQEEHANSKWKIPGNTNDYVKHCYHPQQKCALNADFNQQLTKVFSILLEDFFDF